MSVFVSQTDLIQILLTGDVEEISTLGNDQFFSMLGISFILLMIQNIVTFIPLVLILTVHITFFGYIYGLIWSWVISIITAIIVFFATRYFLKDVLEKKISASVKEKAEQNGFKYVLIARIFPFVPTSLVNVVSGVSSIKLKDFILATSIGNLVYFVLLSFIPLGILMADFEQNVVLIVAGFILLIFVVKKFIKKVFPKKE